MALMEYNGYYAEVKMCDDVIFGKLVGINDLVTFQSERVSDIADEFKRAVDDYIDFCKQIPKDPENPNMKEGEEP